MTVHDQEPGLESANYAQHLAEVNKSQDVHVTEDVRSVHGVLVVRRGARIDYKTARQIVRHKLTMPLDKSIKLSNSISAQGIYRRSLEALQKFSDLQQTHQDVRFSKEFEEISTKNDLPPLLAQKLTVMNLRMPNLMNQTVVGAWLACLIGRELGIPTHELALVHLAAVCRDLGLLHINPELLDRPANVRYSTDEWKTMQSHVVASHMILKECDYLPERTLDAVLHHHENTDCTGYPTSTGLPELGQWAQILGVADTVTSLRLKRFAGSGRNIKDTIPVLRVMSDSCRPEVVSAAIAVLGRSRVKPTIFHSFDTLGELKETLHRRARAMMTFQTVLADMPALIPPDAATSHLAKILGAFIERLSLTFARSGHADPETVRWLHMVLEERDFPDLADLVEIDLQQRELMWQLRRFHMTLVRYGAKASLRSSSPVMLLLERMSLVFEGFEEDRELVEVQLAS